MIDDEETMFRHAQIAQAIVDKAARKLAEAGIPVECIASSLVTIGIRVALDDQHMTTHQVQGWLTDCAEALTADRPAGPGFTSPIGHA